MLTNDVAEALATRGHEITWLAVGRKTASGDSCFRKRRDGILEWEISPGFSSTYPVGWQADEERQARKVVASVSRFEHEFDAIHLFHFARIGLRFLELPFFMRSRLGVTLTDYTCVCPDFQLYHRPSGKICSPDAEPAKCLECLSVAHGEQEIRDWRARNIRFINERAGFVCTQSPEQKRLLVAGGVNEDLLLRDQASYHIPSGWHRAARRFQPPFRFGFLGRLSREKGLHVVLDVFSELHETTGCVLDVYGADDGDFSYQAELQALIQRASGVTLHKALPLKYLEAVFHSINCLLIPSLWLENHPLVISYALFFRTAILCSRVASLDHLAGQRGLHFAEAGNSPAWANAMREIMREYPLHQPLDSYVESEFDTFVTDLEGAYQCEGHSDELFPLYNQG